MESKYGTLPIENKVYSERIWGVHHPATCCNQAHGQVSFLPEPGLGIEEEMQKRGHTEDQEYHRFIIPKKEGLFILVKVHGIDYKECNMSAIYE